jgi:hypothetical protein
LKKTSKIPVHYLVSAHDLRPKPQTPWDPE